MSTGLPSVPAPGDREHWLTAQKHLFATLRDHSLVQAYIGATQILTSNGGFVVIQPPCLLTKRHVPEVFCLPEGFRFADLGPLPGA